MDNFWFADIDEEAAEGPTPGYPWQAVLQIHGACHPLEGIWFASEHDTLEFIKRIPHG
jgi:hypothetical protein